MDIFSKAAEQKIENGDVPGRICKESEYVMVVGREHNMPLTF